MDPRECSLRNTRVGVAQMHFICASYKRRWKLPLLGLTSQRVIDSLMAHWNHSLDVVNLPTKVGDRRRNPGLALDRTSVYSASRKTLGAKP